MVKRDELVFEKTEILTVLKKVNFILISLNRIGSYYNDIEQSTYEHWTTEFIDKSRVTNLLSEVRRTLSSGFSNDLGDDDMSELERIMDGIEYWQKPSD